MSQKLLLNIAVFNDLLISNEIKKEFAIIPSKNRYQCTMWNYCGHDRLSPKNNIKSLKRLEKKLTKYIYTRILVDDNNTLNANKIIRITENRLYIEENIEQGELDYANEI